MFRTLEATLQRVWNDTDAYLQARARIERDPSEYKSLTTQVQKKDAKNNHFLLRSAATKDPAVLAFVHAPDTIPADLLCVGMQSEYIWKMILDNWEPYSRPEFVSQFSEEAALIHFYKQMGLSAAACAHYYNVWQDSRSSTGPLEVSADLPNMG